MGAWGVRGDPEEEDGMPPELVSVRGPEMKALRAPGSRQDRDLFPWWGRGRDSVGLLLKLPGGGSVTQASLVNSEPLKPVALCASEATLKLRECRLGRCFDATFLQWLFQALSVLCLCAVM
jgi:hypothetical protein